MSEVKKRLRCDRNRLSQFQFQQIKSQICAVEKNKSQTIKLTITLIKQIFIAFCGNLSGILNNKNVVKPVIIFLKNIPNQEQNTVQFSSCQ